MLNIQLYTMPKIIIDFGDVWSALTAIGTIALAGITVYPIIKDNWRKLWIKIADVAVSQVLSDPSNFSSPTELTLVLGITNKMPFDIGIQTAYLRFYKKRRSIFAKQEYVYICFGNRERYSKERIIHKLDSNAYFLHYNNKVATACIYDLIENGMPNDTEISKIELELYTTVGRYLYRAPHKSKDAMMATLKDYKFPEPDNIIVNE